jgi:hypothetical protein
MPEKMTITLPRGLIFLASAWLLVSWLIAVGIRPPIHPSSSTYTPAAQVLLASIVLGGLVAWPLLRLSGPARSRPISQSLLDMVSLLVLLQIVLWPLRLVTSWTVSRLILIDLSICAWLTTCSAIIAIGITISSPFRTSAMLLLIAWILGPLLISTIGYPGLDFQASPIGSIWSLASHGGELPDDNAWIWMGIGWFIAALAWSLACLLTTPGRFSGTEVPPGGGDSSQEKIA